MKQEIEKIFNTVKSKHMDEDAILEDIYRTEDLSSLIKVSSMNHYIGVLELKANQLLRQVSMAKEQRNLEITEFNSTPANRGRKSITPLSSPFHFDFIVNSVSLLLLFLLTSIWDTNF
jgi:hypothetical protein